MKKESMESEAQEYLTEYRGKRAEEAEKGLSLRNTVKKVMEMEDPRGEGLTLREEMAVGVVLYVRKNPTPKNVKALAEILGELDGEKKQEVSISFLDNELAKRANEAKYVETEKRKVEGGDDE